MDYELRLKTGEAFTLTGSNIDATALTDTLNNHQILFVNFGGIVLQKHVVDGLIPLLSKEQTEDVKEDKGE